MQTNNLTKIINFESQEVAIEWPCLKPNNQKSNSLTYKQLYVTSLTFASFYKFEKDQIVAVILENGFKPTQ